MEGIASARSFMSALRLAASSKPVLVLKSGRREAAQAAALTHSAVLAHRDEVFDCALRRAGAVRVNSFVELFAAAKCIGAPLNRGRKLGRGLALVSNGSGPGVLAADWAARQGLQLSQWQDLPQPEGAVDFVSPVLALQQQADVDAVLVLHAPLPESDGEASASALAAAVPQLHKPLLACWMGDHGAGSARQLLSQAGLPSFRTPESAVGAFALLADYHAHQRLLQQVPYPLSVTRPPDLAGARLLVDNVLAQRRQVLSEMESKTLLAAFHIPVTPTMRARSAHEAMMIATQMGFPVALKIDAEGISHKSDVDGVVLGLNDAQAVRDAFDALLARVRQRCPEADVQGATVQRMAGGARARELHIGVKHEPPFGPVIVFGAGGIQVELMDDVAMELPPLNRFLAQQLIQRARIHRALGEWRGAPPIAMEALEALLLRLSELVSELPQLLEMDINPVLADEHGVVAVDARIVLHASVQAPPGQGAGNYRHLAIRPYPAQLTQQLSLRDSSLCLLRAIRPDDATLLQQLVASLSPESRYNRFAATLTELPPSLLARFTQIDYEREMALVAVRAAAADGSEPERIVGVARYTLNPGGRSAEFALLVSDAFSGQGLGRRLMECLMAVAREQGLAQIDGLVLCKNSAMLKLMRALGFAVQAFEEDEDFKLVSKTL
jgi:acetyltransferase